MDFLSIIESGFYALADYLSAHVIACLVPAFFIAGGITVFVSKTEVLKYFGADVKKYLSYGVASISGTILAVCSCTILPLFAGIYRQGAGLGPAVTFLFSGPAINLLAIVYTARLIGLDIGIARAVSAVGLSIVLGLTMEFIFRSEEKERVRNIAAMPHTEGEKTGFHLLAFFGAMVGILIVASAGYILLPLKIGTLVLLFVLLAMVLKKWFTTEEIKDWMKETWDLAKLILPLLLIGVFIAGLIKAIIPERYIALYLGGNTIQANFIASIFGALMYFATLTEVPIVMALMEMGMGKGPALALLLSGPSLSLPSILVLRSILGNKKTLTYVSLVVTTSTIIGLLFGRFAG